MYHRVVLGETKADWLGAVKLDTLLGKSAGMANASKTGRPAIGYS